MPVPSTRASRCAPAADWPVSRVSDYVALLKGIESGRRLRIRGKGLAKSKDERGDLYAVVKVVVPKRLTAAERSLFEELQRTSHFRGREA